MSELGFKAISFQEKEIGKIIKSSKKEYVWNFEIERKICFLILKISKFSGNYTVLLNNKSLTKNNILYDEDVNFIFKIKELEFNIYRKADSFELTIEGTIFKNFYETNHRRTVFIKIGEKKFQQMVAYDIEDMGSNRSLRNNFGKRSLSANKELSESVTHEIPSRLRQRIT